MAGPAGEIHRRGFFFLSLSFWLTDSAAIKLSLKKFPINGTDGKTDRQESEPSAAARCKLHHLAAWSHLNEIRISARP